MGIYARHNSEWYRVDEGGSAGADLLGGVAGWAAIESVTGTATPDQAGVDQLIADGIAPTGATHDDECPGTYNIVGDDGVVYRVAVWTENSGEFSFVTSGGLLDTLVVSGGGVNSNTSAFAGQVHAGLHTAKATKYFCHVGTGGNPAHASSIWDPNDSGQRWIIASTMSGYGAGNYGEANGGSVARAGKFSDITGVNIEYAGGAGRTLGTPGSAAQSPPEPISSFPGIVVVRAPKDAANNPKPDAPVAWGQFRSVPTGFTDEGAYVDGKGRAWKWYEFADSGDFTIDLTGGQYWVLCVGGGDAGWTAANQDAQQGQPGTFNEGYWEFPTGATSITVGSKSLNPMSTNDFGMPSSIGDYGTQGIQSFGHALTGRGATGSSDHTGYRSSITGKLLEYATGYQGTDRPGRAGRASAVDNRDGCVIIAAVTNEESDWNPPGALPGLGGWATITDVKGKGNKYSYTDAAGDWVAYEFTDDGSLDTQAGGLVDAFILSGGSSFFQRGGQDVYGNGGFHFAGITQLDASGNDVVVGAGGIHQYDGSRSATWGKPSSVGPKSSATTTSGSGGDNFIVVNDLTGEERTYGQNSGASNAPANTGNYSTKNAGSGVVIVRIPKANDGRSDIAGSVAGEPFDIPTTRQTIVQALEEKVEEAREAVRDRRKRR